jgi:hypothetical protein
MTMRIEKDSLGSKEVPASNKNVSIHACPRGGCLSLLANDPRIRKTARYAHRFAHPLTFPIQTPHHCGRVDFNPLQAGANYGAKIGAWWGHGKNWKFCNPLRSVR